MVIFFGFVKHIINLSDLIYNIVSAVLSALCSFVQYNAKKKKGKETIKNRYSAQKQKKKFVELEENGKNMGNKEKREKSHENFLTLKSHFDILLKHAVGKLCL